MSYNPQIDEAVHVYLQPSQIVLSYIVSYVGCLTALELLVRRTHHGGHYNWFLLAGAATAMGGVAIWSMHYIGMQAMIMANGEDYLQLYYYASYTAGSFFLPIAVVTLSFYVFSSSRKASAWRIAVAGVCCGAAICGMHYVGQLGIANYQSVFDWRFVLASVVIAVSAATIALGVFFYLSSRWINALWKRALCAIVLAGAVCLMHWTAVLGTTFRWRSFQSPDIPTGLGRTAAVWVCGAFALASCFVLLALAIVFQHIRRRYARKAQQISLALAYFSHDGNLMINGQGHLPLNRITKNYLGFSHKDNFDVDSVPFSWMYRASRNWSSVNELLPSMRHHIQLERGADNASITSVKGARPYSYITVLKELYCIAAEDLGHAVGLPVTEVGVLFDRILNTGRMTSHVRLFDRTGTMVTDSENESGQRLATTLTRGQVLFLVRHFEASETTYLQTLGYSFAPPRSVVGSLAASMQITTEELRPYLDDLAAYKEMPQMLDAGVHLGCFVVKPVLGGFEILARRAIRNQLPSVRLPIKRLEQWQTSVIAQFNNWEASALLNHWSQDSALRSFTMDQQQIIHQIRHAMEQLRVRVGEQLFDTGRLVAQPLSEPSLDGKMHSIGTATILAFRCVADVHYVHPATSADVFINARLFTTQQHCYPGSSDHAVFSGQVHTEFSAVPGVNDGRRISLVERKSREHINRLLKRPFSMHALKESSKISESEEERGSSVMNHNLSASSAEEARASEDRAIGGIGQRDDASDKRLVSHTLRKVLSPSPPPPDDSASRSRSVFNNAGGVHVSNEIHITVADAEIASEGAVEMTKLGMKTEIGPVRERESVVDILMALTLGGLRN